MDSLLERAQEFRKKASELGLKNLVWLEKKLKNQVWPSLRGSRRDPLLYMGTISVVLFLLVSFITPSFVNNTILPILNQTSQYNNPFAVPGTKIPESPDLSLVQKNSLVAISPPIMVTPQVLGALIEASEFEAVRREITKYTIQDGDSLWSIAVEHDISIDTIVWANNTQSALIRPGQELLILPVSGVMHLVEAGDTVSGLAGKYKTDAEKITTFNDLAGEDDIFEGEVLIIPDGRISSYSAIQPVDSSALARLSTNNFYGQSHDFPYGQCTWWVAQKRAIPSWGNAKDWLGNAVASGYSACQGRYCIPKTGAVICLQGHRIYGHVGYVEQVKADKVIFSEMNYIGWGRMNYRTLKMGDLSIRGYIY